VVSGEIDKYKGILYVSEYLRYLLLENEFCALFDINDVRRLIQLYADSHGFTVIELMENVFEKVFANFLFSMLANQNQDNASLFIRREQYKTIIENFHDKNETDTSILINEYIRELIINLKIVNPELQKYILKYQNRFTKSIYAAIQRNYLHNLIIYDDYDT
jgi:hypothetical protein